jgi:hypothetical protein
LGQLSFYTKRSCRKIPRKNFNVQRGVDACKTYSRGILVLKDGKPAVDGSPEDLARKGTECLACEYECWFRGNSAITIEVPVEGLADYRKKYGTE